MKLVREHINEKFSDESDPIHDMNIGMKSKLTQYQLNHMMNFIRVKIDDVEKMKTFFGRSLEDIYWLGDTSISINKEKYFDNIKNIIRTKSTDKKPMISVDLILRKMGRFMKNVCFHYNTSEGKFFTMEYMERGTNAMRGIIETTYYGDLEAALNVELLQNKMFDQL